LTWQQAIAAWGICFEKLGKNPEAEAAYRQALAIRDKLAAEVF
jgi:hypothetical protein